MKDDPAELESLAEEIGRSLRERGESLAVVETSTGGLLSKLLSNSAVGGDGWRGSVVAYAQSVQTGLLGLTPDLLTTAGAVSPEVSARLAEAVRDSFGATWGLAETGIAGPQTGRRSRKPAGLAYLAVVGPDGTTLGEVRTGHDRRVANKRAFTRELMRRLLERLAPVATPGT